MTLYTSSHDPQGASACDAACAVTWHPLLLSSGGATLQAGIGGRLGTARRDDGDLQITYNGSPLYLYTGDRVPGDTRGQGMDGIWFAAIPLPPP
jgi:predicted lipoprotein with Yx(FWY)xxD motif